MELRSNTEISARLGTHSASPRAMLLSKRHSKERRARNGLRLIEKSKVKSKWHERERDEDGLAPLYFWCAARAMFACAGTSGAISECLPALPKFISSALFVPGRVKTFRISIAVAANGSRRYRSAKERHPRHAGHVVANCFTLLGSFKIETGPRLLQNPRHVTFTRAKNVTRMADFETPLAAVLKKKNPASLLSNNSALHFPSLLIEFIISQMKFGPATSVYHGGVDL